MNTDFDYDLAFSRNIGWVTEAEQRLLKTRRVAIAGLGGVGGSHLLTLARLGIGAFNLSDFDEFGIENFNRQAGASLSSVGQSKLETLVNKTLDINPELDIRTFPEGVSTENLEAFLQDVDVYVDGLDFFALAMRKAVFSACDRLGIPVTTAAPLGMGTAVLNFVPGKMTFEEYFRLEGVSEEEQYLRFFVGLAPARLQSGYLIDPGAIDVFARKGPSTAMGCELCAGAAATQVLKMLLKRGKVVAAPWGLQFDAYANRLAKTWRPGGNNNPLQKLAISIGKKQLLQKSKSKKKATYRPVTAAERVLDLARWAPSGDNTQPWRFELVDENALVVHGSDTRDTVVYDLDGRASQMAIGALLESIEIAASTLGLRARILQRPDLPEQTPTFDVTLCMDESLEPDPLAPYLRVRSVQRRPMSTRPLTATERARLEQSLPEGYRVRWFERPMKRWQVARLMFANAKVRLTMPEAYLVHSKIIDWGQQFSQDRIPEQAVGIDPLTGKLMRWVMQRWERVAMMNRYLAGTLAPRLQLDLVPGLRCAAHFAIVAPQAPATQEDYLQAGRAMQRLWLTSTRLGLGLQPEMTPLIFARYIRAGIPFTQTPSVQRLAGACAAKFKLLMAAQTDQAVFIGRIGESSLPTSRSLRLDLNELIISKTSAGEQSAGRLAE
jgi:molybdopterin/thiamine biosynthesis adenylyltransferase/nitroreductase